MVRNEEKYEQALQFRKRGFTYSEIAKICDVSKSTVSNWFSEQNFSKQITQENIVRAAKDNRARIILLNKAKRAERTKSYIEAVRSAETEFKHYQSSPLFNAGVAIYMTAGDLSDSSPIRLTSNSVLTHAVFIKFATEFLGVDKKHIKFWLILSGKTKLEIAMRYWSEQIKLPIARFGKTQFVNPESKSLHKGTGNTIIGNTVLKRKLCRWVELSSKKLFKQI